MSAGSLVTGLDDELPPPPSDSEDEGELDASIRSAGEVPDPDGPGPTPPRPQHWERPADSAAMGAVSATPRIRGKRIVEETDEIGGEAVDTAASPTAAATRPVRPPPPPGRGKNS